MLATRFLLANARYGRALVADIGVAVAIYQKGLLRKQVSH